MATVNPSIVTSGAPKSISLHKNAGGEFMFRYSLRDRKTGEVMTEKLHFIFLELPNVTESHDGSSNLEKLCYALHNMTVLKSRPAAMSAEIFELLFNSAEIAKFTREEKVRYEYNMRTERDIRNQLAYSREEGRQEGREEGISQGLSIGRNEAAISIAKEMKADGMAVETISRYTGLPSDKVCEL